MDAKNKLLRSKRGITDMGSIFLVVITLVLGLALLPIVIDVSAAAASDPNLSTVAGTIVELIPLFYIFLLLAVVVAEVVVAFKKIK